MNEHVGRHECNKIVEQWSCKMHRQDNGSANARQRSYLCNGFEITFVLEKHVVEDSVLFTNHLVGK